MDGSIRQWLGFFHADDFTAGLSFKDVERNALLERADAACSRFGRFAGNDFLHGYAGIRILSGIGAVLHGVGAKTASLQFDGRLSATGCACDSGSGYSQSTGKTHFALVK